MWKTNVRGYSRSTRENIFRGKIYSLLLFARPSCNFHGIEENLKDEVIEDEGKDGCKDHQIEAAINININQNKRGHKAQLRGER